MSQTAVKARATVFAPVSDDIPSGDVACDECMSDPSQYLTDFGVTCPTCRGTGHFADPDFYDADDGFDARSEFGTMPRLSGRGRGQL